jgi:hypothetical protein
MNLTIVTSGRNDNHAGDFLGRVNRSIETWLPLGAEIIMVEWNPPADQPPLASVIHFHGIRVITVPQDLHNSMHGHDLFPFFEYRAKNVGIRRAQGDWILSMNPDILLCEEMRQFLLKDHNPMSFYQANRHDIDADGNKVQICRAPGDFLLAHRETWHSLTGYLDVVSSSHLDSLLVWNLVKEKFGQVEVPFPIYHQEHDRSGQKHRMSIHSSDIHRLVGQRNDFDWGLANIQLPETTT